MAAGASIAAVSVESPADSKALAEKLGLSFPVLSDPERRVIRGFGVQDRENGIAWPSIFVIAKDGKIA